MPYPKEIRGFPPINKFNPDDFIVGNLGLIVLDLNPIYRFKYLRWVSATDVQWSYILYKNKENIYVRNLAIGKLSDGYQILHSGIEGEVISCLTGRGGICSIFKDSSSAIEYIYKRQLISIYYNRLNLNKKVNIDFKVKNISDDFLDEFFFSKRLKKPSKKSIIIPKRPFHINGYIYPELDRIVI